MVAPGGSREPNVRIVSTHLGGGYGHTSGTSVAAAHGTGAFALALGVDPQLSPDEAMQLLKSATTDLGYDPDEQGEGLIDAEELVEALR
jgi:subtilisin family serine protease